MTTKLFFRPAEMGWARGQGDNDLSGTQRNWSDRALDTTAGAGVNVLSVTSVAGPTNGIEVGAALDRTLPWEWISDPLSAAVTISGSIAVNLWGDESSMNANALIGVVIQRLNSEGAVVSTIAQGTVGIELGTASAVRSGNLTPTSTNMLKGDRIRARVYFDDAGTMGSGFTLSFSYDAGTGVDGDSYITFNETFGFLTTAPAGSTLYLTDTASAVDPNGASYDAKEAWTSRGSGVVGPKETSPVNGPTAPLLARQTTTGNFLEWFTRQLTGFTLADLATVNVRCAESLASANATARVEIAVCDSDGTNPVVWSAATDSTEFGGAESAIGGAILAGVDTTVADGKRLRLRVYFDDTQGSAMGATGVLQLWYNGTAAGFSGDSYVRLTQSVTEFTAAAASLLWSPAPSLVR